jgi:alpha-amylase
MGVMIQTFYWDCPKLENKEFQWWTFVAGKIPELQQVGFTALWLPPACKAANIGGMSMGYDPYDYFDLGEFDQKGSVPTWFGPRVDLAALIQQAHQSQMQVYADFVINHNNGGDGQELNPIDGQTRWTKFSPKSGKFPRTWPCFHPSRYEQWDGGTFGDMPDLCHRAPYVYQQLIECARWMIEDIGFDGFRYDFVKGYGGWMVRAIQELRYLKNNQGYKPFAVGECWDSDRVIDDWLDETNAWMDNPVSAFDFPLKYKLNDLCDTFGFSLRGLVDPDTLLWSRPVSAVTFVDNHDTERNSPAVNDKMLAYGFILTHGGYPCVYWRDYFNYGLAREGSPTGIAALVGVHEQFAGGSTNVLYLDDGLYVMQRTGAGSQKGLVFVLNNRGDAWSGATVQTAWSNTRFIPRAWWGTANPTVPQGKQTQQDGRGDFWAPPRGYVVYVPQ